MLYLKMQVALQDEMVKIDKSNLSKNYSSKALEKTNAWGKREFFGKQEKSLNTLQFILFIKKKIKNM